MIALNHRSLYTNQGNRSILQFLDKSDRTILDIGCGAGDNGRLIHSLYPQANITGITCSENEYEQAVEKLDYCICSDLEREPLPVLPHKEFDVLIFSHVLEHLVDPVATIQQLLPSLRNGGKVIVALPNIANWRERWKLALGRFEYTDSGVMDKTHLHFYTFYTAPLYLIDTIPELKLVDHLVNGSVPLGLLRHQFLSMEWRNKIDKFGCRLMPNLFGGEIVMQAVKLN